MNEASKNPYLCELFWLFVCTLHELRVVLWILEAVHLCVCQMKHELI
jgi:hypothetical protein